MCYQHNQQTKSPTTGDMALCYYTTCRLFYQQKKKGGIFMPKKYKVEHSITIDGKRKVFRGDTEKEVRKKILEYKNQVSVGIFFNQAAEEWKEEHWKTLEYNSTKNYNGAFKRIISYFNGTRIKEIFALDIDIFLKDMKQQGFAKKTISNHLCILNMIFNYAVVQKYITNNPCICVSIPKNLPQTKRSPLSAKNEKIIINNLNDRIGVFLYFLMMTGMREGEALALTGKNIDIERRIIDISNSIYWTNDGKPHIKSPKTEAGKRIIALPSVLLPFLTNIKKDQILFANSQKSYLHKCEFDKSLNDFKKNTGFDGVPHQCRHTYASICKAASISPKDAQALLGHANFKTTMDTYTHVNDIEIQESAEKLDSFINVHTQYTPIYKNPDEN